MGSEMSALRRFSVFAGSVTALVVAGVSGSAAASSPPPPHPGSSWKTVAPAKVGLNGKVLKGIAQTAKQGKSNCLVVVRDGKLAGEWYFRGTNRNTTQDVYSVSKSVSSTLVGIAQDEGKLKVGDSASRWIPAWRGGPAAAVKVRDLLSMNSGRQWSFLTDYVQFLRAANRTAFAVGLPQQHAPGQVWAYNNAAVQTLQPVLQAATGREVTAFAAAKLFRPLGMTRTRMTTDKAGNAQTFEGVQSTCRDMARFGVMMLGRGRWGRRQIVSSAWIKRATGPSSTRLNAGYGYLWWLNHYGVLASPESATSLGEAMNPTTKKGRIAPGAPDGLYWALGLGNQVVQVDPASKTVVVRLGTPEVGPQPPTFGPVQASKVVTEAVVHKRR
jgi:CubicO group peptidase (beta-lactamase class C family)